MRYCVQRDEDGWTLNALLRKRVRLSLGALRRVKWHGVILVNSEPSRVTRIVHSGDIIDLDWPEQRPAYIPEPSALSLNIVYEDDDLIIIDKPAPLPTLTGRRHDASTLENAVFSYFGCPADFVFRPVNRLDKGTSGLMTVAKNGYTQELLQRMLHTDRFMRGYTAIVEGTPSPLSETIDSPIAKEHGPTIRRIVTPDGKPSVTHYKTIKSSNGRSLVSLYLETGRTHQIRVHLASIGCPVTGDFLYGMEIPELPGRFALHSSQLYLVHPISGQTLDLASPLPEELVALMPSADLR